MPLATAKFHFTQHTEKKQQWTQYKFRVPGAYKQHERQISASFQTPEIQGYLVYSGAGKRFIEQRETPLAQGGVSKVQLWPVQLFTLMILEHVYSQTPKQLGCLRTSGEEALACWPPCNGRKE